MKRRRTRATAGGGRKKVGRGNRRANGTQLNDSNQRAPQHACAGMSRTRSSRHTALVILKGVTERGTAAAADGPLDSRKISATSNSISLAKETAADACLYGLREESLAQEEEEEAFGSHVWNRSPPPPWVPPGIYIVPVYTPRMYTGCRSCVYIHLLSSLHGNLQLRLGLLTLFLYFFT